MNLWMKAFTVGAITGIRSTAALRAVFGDRGVVRWATLAESLADKIPGIPSRTEWAPLLARGVLGAFAAARIAPERRLVSRFAALGAVSAVASTYAICAIRYQAGEAGPLAGTVTGFLEDRVVGRIGSMIGEVPARAAS